MGREFLLNFETMGFRQNGHRYYRVFESPNPAENRPMEAARYIQSNISNASQLS